MTVLPALAVASFLLTAVSCSPVQRFTLADPSNLAESQAQCETFIRGKVSHDNFAMNLTTRENLQWGAPGEPQNGWKQDMTVRIEEILKGEVDEDIIVLRDLAPVAFIPSTGVSWPYLVDTKEYWIGWQDRRGARFAGLILIPSN